MNVALVCERFDPRGGGLEQWVAQLAHRLQQRGHRTDVVTFRADAPANGIALHVLPWSDSRTARARTAGAALDDLDVDLVHDVGVGCRCDILHPQGGSRLANSERDAASQSWPERGAQWLRPAFWRWRAEWRANEYRQYAQHRGLVIAGSRKVVDDLERVHGFPRERTRVIPNGVDVRRFSPDACAVHRGAMRDRLDVRDDDTVFLFAAHNPRLKGIRPLLRAMRAVHARCPRAVLVVIGREPDRRLRARVERLGLGSAVRFEGVVQDQFPCYAAADVFVLPTYYDACSLSVLEAAACGLPAITTRDNGVSELLTHGHDGFVLNSADDIDALVQTMIDLTERVARARIAGPARALAVRHNLDHSIEMIERVYDEVRPRLRRRTSA